jgi:general secretion pathway protein G
MLVRRRARLDARCPYCRATVALFDVVWICPRCSTYHHADCARENGRCTVFGCAVLAVIAKKPEVRRSRRALALFIGFVETTARIAGIAFVLLLIVGTPITLNLTKHMDFEGRRVRAKADLRALDDAVKLYKVQHGVYPKTLGDLFPEGREPYVSGKTCADELRDPWNAPYVYVPPACNTCYDIASQGEPGAGSEIHLKDALAEN